MAALLCGLLLAGAVLVSPARVREVDEAVDLQQGDVHMPAEDTAARAPGTAPVAGASNHVVSPPSADEVASALVLLALGYRSGLPTWQVLCAVADVVSLAGGTSVGPKSRLARKRPAQRRAVPPAARDLRQVAAALRWGASDEEAWASVDRVWAGAARAVAIAHRAGIPPGPLLLTAADDLRRASLEQVELAAAKVGVRLVAPLALVLLPAFCLTTVVPLVVALGRQMLGP